MFPFDHLRIEIPVLLGEHQVSQVLIYSLWIGFGILALLSMILIWTRWGHAKPLSKCIALSIFAHILLGGYAYGTRLIFNYSFEEKEQPIAFSIMNEPFDQPEAADDSIADATADSAGIEKSEEPLWEKFADDPGDGPGVIELEKVQAHQAELPARNSPETELKLQQHDVTETVTSPLPAAPAPAPEIQTSWDMALRRPEDPALETAPVDAPAPVARRELQEEMPAAINPVARKTPLEEEFQPAVPEPQVEAPEIAAEALRQNLQHQVAQQDAQFVPAANELQDANSVPDPVGEHPFRRVSDPGENRFRMNPASDQKRSVRRRLADGQPIPEKYENRFAENRSLLIEQSGGTPDSQQAVERALRWLGSEQSEDGRWDPRRFNAGNEANVYGHNRGGAGFNADTGITGLVVLAFLGAGHTHLEGPYQKQVQKGLEFLIRTQNADGSMYGDAGLFARTYCHGMATMAIAEAYCLTGDHRIKPFIVKAQQFTVTTQNQLTGGWRYRPGDDGDMSQFGWQVMALKSAEQAGVPIPAKTRELMVRFLRSYEKGKHGGLASYRPAEGPSRTMTAEAMFCRRLLGIDVPTAASFEAVEYVMEELPAESSVDNLYYWYYATLALQEEQSRSASHRDAWQRWNRKLSQRLLALQQAEAGQAGSFSNATLWSAYGGTFYSTAMATLCLEASYRFKSVEHPVDRTARR